MRNLIPILLAIVVLSSGCEPDGYSCDGINCYDDNDNPQYQTLEDCLSLCVCDEITTNTVSCGTVLHEGYEYSTVQIGDQCWFAENCRYLPEVSPSVTSQTWDGVEALYYVKDYEGTDIAEAMATDNYDTYGVLYNWPAVMTEGICPSGWHIPSDGEFTQLTNFLGGEEVAGGKMKEACYDHWLSPNTGATNSSGFTGLPGGNSDLNSTGWGGCWWTASTSGTTYGSWMRFLNKTSNIAYRSGQAQMVGCSARCVQD